MGEARKDALQVGFDRAIKLEFHGARVSSDAGLFPYRDLDDGSELTQSGAANLFDFRTAATSSTASRRCCGCTWGAGRPGCGHASRASSRWRRSSRPKP